ncbi:MAG: TonB-dependent receptor [Chitinophagales bacterium]
MKKALPLLLAFLLLCVKGFTQTVDVRGTVVDGETKETLAGATFKFEKGRGILADASGKFKASLPPGEYELSVSFIGYKTVKWKATLVAGHPLDTVIEMEPSSIQISQTVTVSAYRKNTAKETVTTEVLDKAIIKNTNANDLGEVVAKTPGVLVQDGQISMRGGSSYSYGVGTRTAVMVDGLSLLSADLGEAQSKMVPLSNVKQVEVIKGASSVMYGSSALNGVVNIITQWPTEADPKHELEINTGFYDNPPAGRKKWWGDNLHPFFTNVNFNRQQQVKQFQYVISANLTRNEGYTQTSDELREQVALRTRYLHPKISGLTFGLNASFQQETSNRFFLSTDLDTGAYYIKMGSADNYLRTTVDPHVSYNSLKGHRFVSQWRYMNIFRKGGGTDPNAVSNQIMADNQYQYRYLNSLIITAGLPFNIGISSSNLYPGKRVTYYAATYLQVEYNYKFLTLQGGLRYEISGVDTDRVWGFTYKVNGKNVQLPIFRAGMNIQAAKGSFFRLSWGQGYRVASVAEKYISNEFLNGLRIIPNDTLRSEHGWSAEFGFKQLFQIGKWKGYFDISMFYQRYTDFMEFRLGLHPNRYGNGQPIFPDSVEFLYPGGNTAHQLLGLKAINIENARIAGYEVELGGMGTIGPVGVRLLAGYTYNWPASDIKDSTGKSLYSDAQFFKDMFKYNFKRVGPSDSVGDNLLYYRMRHLVRLDLELSFWKAYLGTTFYYGSMPEKVPALFQAAANLIFKNVNALDEYMEAHKHGDYSFDIRAGVEVTKNLKLGFIVKNIANRYYSLRPGKPEPMRNFTFQLRYNF